jgi:hypothetical protein
MEGRSSPAAAQLLTEAYPLLENFSLSSGHEMSTDLWVSLAQLKSLKSLDLIMDPLVACDLPGIRSAFGGIPSPLRSLSSLKFRHVDVTQLWDLLSFEIPLKRLDVAVYLSPEGEQDMPLKPLPACSGRLLEDLRLSMSRGDGVHESMISGPSLLELARSHPLLRTLEIQIQDAKQPHDLRSDPILDDIFIEMAQSLPHLRTVDLQLAGLPGTLTDDSVDGFLRHCPKLQRFTVEGQELQFGPNQSFKKSRFNSSHFLVGLHWRKRNG